MVLFIDTNVFIDMFQSREPFMDNAREIITSCVTGKHEGFVSSHSLSDMFYILRKDFSSEERKECIRFICAFFTIVAEQKEDFMAAAGEESFADMEDGLQMRCAEKCNADFIITRNVRDFALSSVTALSPDDFLNL